MDQILWNNICAAIDAQTDPASKFSFQVGDWRMRIGPPPFETTNIGFQLADCAWPNPAQSRERIKRELARQAFINWHPQRGSNFRPMSLDAFSFWLPLRPQVCANFQNYLEVYQCALTFLSELGGTGTCAFGQQVDHHLREFSPQVSVGEDSSKGRLTSPTLHYGASFSTLRDLKHRHDISGRFDLAPGSPSFEFESSQFPLKTFDWIKVGNKLCDKSFFFKSKSDPKILKALVPPLNSLAALEARFHIRCQDDSLTLSAKYCDTLSVIPAIVACAEIWRCLLLHGGGVDFTARPTPIFCALPLP